MERVTGQTEYDAYGREVYASGTRTPDFRFAAAKGYVGDDATGMQTLGARYYLPALGRFLTPGPHRARGRAQPLRLLREQPADEGGPRGQAVKGGRRMGERDPRWSRLRFRVRS